MYADTVEIPRPGQARHIHLRSSRGNLATRICKAYFMYAETVEIPRPVKARHIYLRSYRENLKDALYLLFVGFLGTAIYLGSVALKKSSSLGTLTDWPLNGSATFHWMRINTT